MNPLLFVLVMQTAPAPSVPLPAPVETVTVKDSASQKTTQRPKAIEYSDWYYRRLLIHRIGSFVELPLFAAQYTVGQRMISSRYPSASLVATHGALATGTAILFGANTLTGLWNLYDSRNDPAGRTRRVVHSVIMLAADGGFMLTGALAGESEVGAGLGESERGNANMHRRVAISSMSLSAAGTLLMWLWRDR